jgi:hypothetical protein
MAGIILSRHAHGIERATAKHASKERMKVMTAENRMGEQL